MDNNYGPNTEEIINNNSSNSQAETRPFCVKCGAELATDTVFCPKCGHKVGDKVDEASSKNSSSNSKKIIILAICAVAFVAAVIAAVLGIRGVQAKNITLNKKALSVKAGETAALTFTINPADTKNKTVTWTTDNETIALVNEGIVSGINEGECTITVSTKNGKTDMCVVTVLPAGPDLQALYNDYCSSTYATLASDGSYLSIDTNPYDKDDYFDTDAYAAIKNIHAALELPDSVLNDMGHTRSLDGKQSYSTDELEITWTYHPDHGLEINYTLK